MTTATLLRLLADHLLTLDPVDSGYLVNAARKRADELDDITSPAKPYFPKEFASCSDATFLVVSILEWPEPNPLNHWQHFLNELAEDLRLAGMAFVWRVKDALGVVSELWRLPPGDVITELASEAYPKGSYRVRSHHAPEEGIFLRIDAAEVKKIRAGSASQASPPPADEPKTIAWREWL